MGTVGYFHEPEMENIPITINDEEYTLGVFKSILVDLEKKKPQRLQTLQLFKRC